MMKKSNKKGFTMVELIIVIALIAILASVLIPTFANLINKANDSAYQQERTNQMIKDEIEKIDQGKVYMSWEDLEEAIAKALAEKGDDDDLAEKIITIIGDLGKTSTGLTDQQLTKILDAIANKKFSDTQVKVILEGIKDDEDDEKPALTEQQIADILAKLPQTGITEDDLKAAIAAVLGEQSGTINAAVQAILNNLPTALTEEQIKEIVEKILSGIFENYIEYVLPQIIENAPAEAAYATFDVKNRVFYGYAFPDAFVGVNYTIVLLKNATPEFTFLSNSVMTIDLNGKELTIPNNDQGGIGGLSFNTTIVDSAGGGTFKTPEFAPGDGSKFYIKSGNIRCNGDADSFWGGFWVALGIKSAPTIKDIEITGGTFDVDPSAYVPSGYTVTETNGIWTVTKND